MKTVRVDNVEFNAEYYKDHSEAEFIKDQLPSVQDFYGDKEQKTAFLKIAFAAIQKTKPAVEKKK